MSGMEMVRRGGQRASVSAPRVRTEVRSRRRAARVQPTERIRLVADALHQLAGRQVTEDVTAADTAEHLLTLASVVVPSRYVALVPVLEGQLASWSVERQGSQVRRSRSPRGLEVLRAAEHSLSAGGLPETGEPPETLPLAPTRTELAVPLWLPGRRYGWLYLTDPVHQVFDDTDREVLALLGRGAALHLAQAETGDRFRQRLRWLQASKSLTENLLSPLSTGSALAEVADLVLQLADADLVTVVTPAAGSGRLEVAAVATRQSTSLAAELRGLGYPDVPDSLVARAMRSGRACAVASMAESTHPVKAKMRELAGLGPVLAAPLNAEAPQGAILISRVADRPVFTADDLEMAELFAHQAGVAYQAVRARSDASRLSVLEQRDRLAREAGDSLLQRLFALGASLQSVLNSPLERSAENTVERVLHQVGDVVRDVRRTVVAPPGQATLAAVQAGVLDALHPLTSSLGFRPTLTAHGLPDAVVPGPLVPAVVSVAYEMVKTAATSGAVEELTLRLSVDEHWLILSALEAARGGVDLSPYPAWEHLEDRAEQHDGHVALLDSEAGHRRITWAVPLDPAEPAALAGPSAARLPGEAAIANHPEAPLP